MTNQEFTNQLAEIKELAAMTRKQLNETLKDLDNNLDKPNIEAEEDNKVPNWIPMRHYLHDDFIALAQPCKRPASMREAVTGINIPAEGESWQDLNEWRAAFGLAPVTR